MEFTISPTATRRGSIAFTVPDTDENIGMTPDGKGKMIAIFYKILMDGADMEDLSGLLKEVTDIARKKAGK